ncbi:hypothetical protein PBY51_024252 [Eleginops maclovinus]|uniref:Uncharacterized protein n=1 Tax=Eleginops maclovinus TaxID=56733 RepID=A0AAN7Y0M3_ELEMC|nr:hypothetical protein PBY51_024252 [Eleginops maclovinus]
MSFDLPYLAFPSPLCDTLSLVLKEPNIPLPVYSQPSCPSSLPGSCVNPTIPTPHLFPPGLPTPRSPHSRSSYPGLGSPRPCLSFSLPSPLLCLPQPQPSAQCSRGEPARNAVALDVLSKP